jgi:biopolymer transport protein ExbD
MAMSVGHPRREAIAEINVTPMADVMIVLLIIFMVATPVLVQAPVRLPPAAHPTEHKGEMLKIALRADGSLLIDGASFADAASLTNYLAARASATRSLLVLIQADGDASYADVARVLAACRTSGISEIALGAQLRAGS